MCSSTKIFGIICEFNPFHSGHEFLIRQARENGAELIIAVMSGNYVQRGEMAIFDKWARTRAAILGGVDIVIELPLPYAMSSADTFCKGGISILDNLNCVDSIIFGSECGSVSMLREVVELTESERFKQALQSRLSDGSGKSYANIYENTLSGIAGEEYAEILRSPNNTLAIGYIRELLKRKSEIRPVTVKRTESGIKSPSATTLRELIKAGAIKSLGNRIPSYALEIYKNEINEGRAPVYLKKLELSVLSKLRMSDVSNLANVPDISEGIENKLLEAGSSAKTLEELYFSVKSKRYTMSRVRRLVMSSFLDIDKKIGTSGPPYARILGMSKIGQEAVSYIIKRSKIPVFIRYSDIDKMNNSIKEVFNIERRADDIYALAAPEIQPSNRDLTERLIIL